MKISACFAKRRTHGFTLVELLVVIAIIAILAAVVILIINPLELTRRGRDSNRITDMTSLRDAINVAVQEATNSGAAVLCANTGTYPCNGNSVTDSRAVTGLGWVRVNLSASAQAVSIPTLPRDPVNSSGAAGYHYAYCANNDTWEINTRFESQKYRVTDDIDGNDGGDDLNLYENGSAFGLIGFVSGCTY